ncbi:Nuclease-related domain protein [Bhargavaea cecembensis DSE10]|uniref:Nuclease-related domain protein n=1 Tax=Bhargavaea cecembensis DSE10 TaxID=1235279 RepID=M7NLB2_9BACL|nr:nuclease-related domain-containing protein [Bhargavaea cecembensis]EMR07921.1 Nuclease-related domain protein [Bhargavaea cecembensis DSE10]
MNSTDWEIHSLERAVVRLQHQEPVINEPHDVPTVEAMLGVATNDRKFKRERRQALEDIEAILYRKKAGRVGEEAVEQTLSEMIFPEGTHVFRNASLLIRKGYRVEIDVLILTPSFALVLEVKNIAGTLFFNEEEGKTVRIRENGQADEFDCYVHQLDRQISGLNQFLASHQISLPIYGAVVLANQNTVVKKRPVTFPLLYRKQLARHFRSLRSDNPILSAVTVNQLSRLFGPRVEEQQEQPLCMERDLSPLMFRRGVLCLQCNQRILAYQGRGWYCRTCEIPGREAVRQAVEDRLILINLEITNKQCREFLMIGHSSQATRILKSLELNKFGEPPGTSYYKIGKGPLKWAEESRKSTSQ